VIDTHSLSSHVGAGTRWKRPSRCRSADGAAAKAGSCAPHCPLPHDHAQTAVGGVPDALVWAAGGLGLSAVGPAQSQKRMFALEMPSQFCEVPDAVFALGRPAAALSRTPLVLSMSCSLSNRGPRSPPQGGIPETHSLDVFHAVVTTVSTACLDYAGNTSPLFTVAEASGSSRAAWRPDLVWSVQEIFPAPAPRGNRERHLLGAVSVVDICCR
jgi:hypothetical protein